MLRFPPGPRLRTLRAATCRTVSGEIPPVAKAQRQRGSAARSRAWCPVRGAGARLLPLERHPIGEHRPNGSGATGELGDARSRVEEAPTAYFAVSANYPSTYADAPLSPPKRLANPSAAMPELKATNKTTSAPFLPQSNLVGSHRLRSSHSRIKTILRARSAASTRIALSGD
jgi:hypothetical protein